jgi:hypothetical protein
MNTNRKFWFVLTGIILGITIIACSCGSILNTPTVAPGSPSKPTPVTTLKTSQSLLYSDDFSNPGSGWSILSDSQSSTGYADGSYKVIIKTHDSSIYGFASKLFGDTVIDVDVATRLVPSSTLDFASEVGCRAQENGDGYIFRIVSDGGLGYFSVGYYTDAGSRFVSLMSAGKPQASEAVKPGLTTNHITVGCAGSDLWLKVNGVSLYAGKDATFAAGDITLGAFLGKRRVGGDMVLTDDDDFEVNFDNLAVTTP